MAVDSGSGDAGCGGGVGRLCWWVLLVVMVVTAVAK